MNSRTEHDNNVAFVRYITYLIFIVMPLTMIIISILSINFDTTILIFLPLCGLPFIKQFYKGLGIWKRLLLNRPENDHIDQTKNS